MTHHPRPARASDYPAIAAVVDDWWGRPILGVLPRLFLDHFHHTSLVIDGPGGPLAFLVGILSPADPRQAYVHFVGVAPQARRQGVAELLYTEFFALARAGGPDHGLGGHRPRQYRLHRLSPRDGVLGNRPRRGLQRPRPGSRPLRPRPLGPAPRPPYLRAQSQRLVRVIMGLLGPEPQQSHDHGRLGRSGGSREHHVSRDYHQPLRSRPRPARPHRPAHAREIHAR